MLSGDLGLSGSVGKTDGFGTSKQTIAGQRGVNEQQGGIAFWLNLG